MDYKLVKSLKDAGFPQTGERDWYCDGVIMYDKDEENGILEKCEETEPIKYRGDSWCDSCGMAIDPDNMAEIPTLSELIEACGDGFRSLIVLKGKNRAYRATNTLPILNEDGYDFEEAIGKTPEESVAKLWLKLNEKK